MVTRLLKFGIVLATLLAVGACSSTWEEGGINNSPANNGPVQTVASAAAASAPITANQIQLFPGSNAGKAYTVIQDVRVAVNKTTAFNADPTVAQVEERLRKTAAELGGDAVVNVVVSDVRVRALSWGGRIGTGTVVKY